MKTNQMFYYTSPDPDFTYEVWFYPSQNTMYTYDISNNECFQNNNSKPIMNFCVGGVNQTFFANITIGSMMVDVWQTTDPMSGDNVYLLVDTTGCIPVDMQQNPSVHIGQNGFRKQSLFYDFSTSTSGFPSLPEACITGVFSDIAPKVKLSKIIDIWAME